MTRRVLAFDTATEQVALALGEHDGASVKTTHRADFPAPRAALGALLPAVDALLSASGLTVADLDCIVVGRGPGSFTGVRIGVATAKGLAHGVGVPLHGVCTLDAVAWMLRDREGLLGILGDAMRGEVYPALYRAHAGQIVRLSADRVAPPHELAREWAELGESLVLAGNALTKYGDVFAGLGEVAPPSDWEVRGEGLLAAWADTLQSGAADSGDPGALLPIYTRLSDAEENERARRNL